MHGSVPNQTVTFLTTKRTQSLSDSFIPESVMLPLPFFETSVGEATGKMVWAPDPTQHDDFGGQVAAARLVQGKQGKHWPTHDSRPQAVPQGPHKSFGPCFCTYAHLKATLQNSATHPLCLCGPLRSTGNLQSCKASFARPAAQIQTKTSNIGFCHLAQPGSGKTSLVALCRAHSRASGMSHSPPMA